MSSIRNRLIGILIGTTGLVWLFAVVWIYMSTQGQVEKVLDARLMEAARMVNSLLTDPRAKVGPDGGIGQFTPKPIPDFPDYDRQLFCQIWSLDGNLVGRSASAPSDRLTETSNGFSNTVVAGETWRVFTVENTQLGLRVMVGDSMRIREQLVRDVIIGLILPALLILPFLAGMIWLSVRRGLQPLSVLAATLSKRSAQDLKPLPDEDLPSEIAPAVTALNGLFQRVEDARERERSFAIFAAHELKTPLAGIKTQAQIAIGSKDTAVRDNAIRQIASGVDRTSRLVRQLLDMASLETGEEIRETLPEKAGKLLAAIALDLRMLAASRKVTINIAPASADVTIFHPHLFTLAARNLLENAINHSAADGVVRCDLTANEDGIVLQVEDDGQGIAECDLPHVTERFFRGSNRSENGSGLGLAIVQQAADRLGGCIEISNREPKGVLAIFSLPHPDHKPQSSDPA